MPIGQGIANGYIQLGVSGAALLIVLVSVILNSRQNSKLINSEGQKVDKLCDKIDELVTIITKSLVTNDKDQEGIKNDLDFIREIVVDTQRRVSRIDDRTYQCLGNPKKEIGKGEGI